MSEESPEVPKGRLGKVQAWVSLVRDVGLALGVPALFAVGVWLHEAQISATEAQVKASEAQTKLAEAHNGALREIFEAQERAAAAQAKAVEAQNAALKETQYDRALALLNSQKALFDQERVEAKKQLDQERADSQRSLDDTLATYLARYEELHKSVENLKFSFARQRSTDIGYDEQRQKRLREIELQNEKLRKENEELLGRLNSPNSGKLQHESPPP